MIVLCIVDSFLISSGYLIRSKLPVFIHCLKSDFPFLSIQIIWHDTTLASAALTCLLFAFLTGQNSLLHTSCIQLKEDAAILLNVRNTRVQQSRAILHSVTDISLLQLISPTWKYRLLLYVRCILRFISRNFCSSLSCYRIFFYQSQKDRLGIQPEAIAYLNRSHQFFSS